MTRRSRLLQRVRRDQGFTLIEVLIGIVLSAIIGGVVVGSLITSTSIAEIATDQVNDSTDAGLIAAFLTRDAQAAGGVDPSSATLSQSIGVAAAANGSSWAKCEQDGAFVARFSWLDRMSSTAQRSVVATYALRDSQLTRRICQDGTSSVSSLGAGVTAAELTCSPDPTCGDKTSSVMLDVVGGTVADPFTYQLRAELRRDLQAMPSSATASPVPLLALGDSAGGACPVLKLTGKSPVTVLGDVVASTRCGSAPISGSTALLRATGTVVATLTGDPLLSVTAPSFSCGGLVNPSPIGASPTSTSIVVYQRRVTITSAVDFRPGQYVFCDGFELAAGAVVTGSNVSLHALGANSVIDPAATVQLTGPANGTYRNIVLWLMSPQQLTIPASSVAVTYNGIVYAPTSAVTVVAGAGANIGGLIASSIEIGGVGDVRLGLPIPTLTLTPSTLPGGQAGVVYSSTAFAASGGTAPYRFAATGLPQGLSLNAAGVLSGTPTQFGTFTVLVTTADATSATATTRFTLSINAPLAFAAPTSLANGQVGLTYPAASATTTGGTAPIIWSASGLPAGLAMSPSGQLSGSPTASGAFTVTLTARDAVGATVSRTLSLSVAARLAIAGPATLPAGQVGTGYTATTMLSSGGTAPVTWSAIGLPAGLSINPATGAITGTPTSAGATTVTVAVADAAGATASTTYSMTVTSTVPAGCSPTMVGWRGEYFSNINLTAPNTVCRDDAAINFDWAYGSPDPAVRVSDNFSVRWTRSVDFAAGQYVFTLGSDDGGRLYIDGALVIDRWVDQAYPASPPTYLATLTQGAHTIVVEYYERGGYAKAVLNWAPYKPVTCPGTASGWIGQYYATANLSGPMVLCRDDASINFDWGSGSPAAEVPADRFSARWTKQQNFAAGTYTFRMGTDDGGRLYIDGVLVLDRWVDQAYPSNVPSVSVRLTAGVHTIVLEYYENGGVAAATLTWV